MNAAESLPLLEDIQSYVNHVFNTVRHLPTICFDGSRPKEFLRKKIFVKTKKNERANGSVNTIGYFYILFNQEFIQINDFVTPVLVYLINFDTC